MFCQSLSRVRLLSKHSRDVYMLPSADMSVVSSCALVPRSSFCPRPRALLSLAGRLLCDCLSFAAVALSLLLLLRKKTACCPLLVLNCLCRRLRVLSLSSRFFSCKNCVVALRWCCLPLLMVLVSAGNACLRGLFRQLWDVRQTHSCALHQGISS